MERIKDGMKMGKLLGKIASLLLAVLALGGLYFTLVFAHPQTQGREAAAPQPQLTASPGLEIRSEGDLRELAARFPAPMMSFMSGSGMSFVSGKVEDAPIQGQIGRKLTLYWQMPTGEPLMLQSIYPAAMLELLGKGDYIFSDMAGPTLFGLTSVRMENAETIRVHVQAEGKGIYAVTVPKELSASLSAISRSIQLFTLEEE